MDIPNCSADVSHQLLAAAGQRYCWSCGKGITVKTYVQEHTKAWWKDLGRHTKIGLSSLSFGLLSGLFLGLIAGGGFGLKVAGIIELSILTLASIIIGFLHLGD